MSGMAQALEAVTPPRIYYFGCGRIAGHYWHAPNPDGDKSTWLPSSAISSAMRTVFGDEIDGRLAPDDVHPKEGAAQLSHIRGWTVLAWWDRSVDNRWNANSALVVDRHRDFDQMVALLAIHFPEVSRRQRRPLKLEQMLLRP